MAKYYVLMGDIINSRKIKYSELTKILHDIFKNSNLIFSEQMVTDLSIKVGDDFQVIMKNMSSLLQLLYYIDIYLLYNNINCRFAIGYGLMDINSNRNSKFELGGNTLAFTNDILTFKDNDKKYRFFIEDDIIKEIALNTIGLLLEGSVDKLTPKQIEYLYFKIVKKLDNKMIQKELGVKERNIYRLQKLSHNEIRQTVFRNIVLLFNEHDQELKEYFEEYQLPNRKERNL